jgi:hypothetical protein
MGSLLATAITVSLVGPCEACTRADSISTGVRELPPVTSRERAPLCASPYVCTPSALTTAGRHAVAQPCSVASVAPFGVPIGACMAASGRTLPGGLRIGSMSCRLRRYLSTLRCRGRGQARGRRSTKCAQSQSHCVLVRMYVIRFEGRARVGSAALDSSIASGAVGSACRGTGPCPSRRAGRIPSQRRQQRQHAEGESYSGAAGRRRVHNVPNGAASGMVCTGVGPAHRIG